MIKERGIDLVRKFAYAKKLDKELIEAYYNDETITKDDIYTVLYEVWQKDKTAYHYIDFIKRQKDKLTLHQVKGKIIGVELYMQ